MGRITEMHYAVFSVTMASNGVRCRRKTYIDGRMKASSFSVNDT